MISIYLRQISKLYNSEVKSVTWRRKFSAVIRRVFYPWSVKSSVMLNNQAKNTKTPLPNLGSETSWDGSQNTCIEFPTKIYPCVSIDANAIIYFSELHHDKDANVQNAPTIEPGGIFWQLHFWSVFLVGRVPLPAAEPSFIVATGRRVALAPASNLEERRAHYKLGPTESKFGETSTKKYLKYIYCAHLHHFKSVVNHCFISKYFKIWMWGSWWINQVLEPKLGYNYSATHWPEVWAQQ